MIARDRSSPPLRPADHQTRSRSPTEHTSPEDAPAATEVRHVLSLWRGGSTTGAAHPLRAGSAQGEREHATATSIRPALARR